MNVEERVWSIREREAVFIGQQLKRGDESGGDIQGGGEGGEAVGVQSVREKERQRQLKLITPTGLHARGQTIIRCV